MTDVSRRAAAWLLCAVVLWSGCAPSETAGASHGATVTIRGQPVAVEVVRTPAEQSLGLGNRDSLEWDRGMLFVYERLGILTFWMKRMRFDIDIVWVRDQRIVGIAEFVPYPRQDPSKPATVRAPELVDMVLEVPAGYARSHGWRRGDRLTLAGIAGPSQAGN